MQRKGQAQRSSNLAGFQSCGGWLSRLRRLARLPLFLTFRVGRPGSTGDAQFGRNLALLPAALGETSIGPIVVERGLPL